MGQEYDQLLNRHVPSIGAAVCFVGLVRDRNEKAGDGAQVETLTLEHYPGMTEASVEKILQEASERWPLLEVSVIHRVGELRASDQIVLAMAASAHREAAFAAAEFVMDYLKTDAVFWKKERSRDGDTWIQSVESDRSRRKAWERKP